MTQDREQNRRGIAPVLIVVPSLVSGAGVAFVLVGILANNQILQDTFVVMGILLLWADFFVTMALFRYTVRNIDRRLGHIETQSQRDRS